MAKAEMNNSEVVPDMSFWVNWFEMLRLTTPKCFNVVATVLGDFVEQYPADAGYVTVGDLMNVLIEIQTERKNDDRQETKTGETQTNQEIKIEKVQSQDEKADVPD